MSATSVAYFVLGGLVGTAAGRLLRFFSIEAVGPSISAGLLNVTPLVASVLAVLPARRAYHASSRSGTVVIVAGTTLLSDARQARRRPPGEARPPDPVGGVLRPRDGSSEAGAGGHRPALRLRGQRDYGARGVWSVPACLRPARGNGLPWAHRLVVFVAAGVSDNLAVLLVIVALSLGTVSVVAPSRASPRSSCWRCRGCSCAVSKSSTAGL
jgi:drug/metabolite transporter (DMT)-like permease